MEASGAVANPQEAEGISGRRLASHMVVWAGVGWRGSTGNDFDGWRP